jgi:hypothetical protein
VTSDPALQRRALELLGPLGHPVAREVLETGKLEIEHDVSRWEGSAGLVHAHRVVACVDPELYERAAALPGVTDALTEAVAAAVSADPLQALAELRLEPRVGGAHRETPYRG